MKPLTTYALALLIASGAFATETADLLPGAAEKELLQKKCIRTQTSGILPVPYPALTTMLKKPDLVSAVQHEYARSVSKTGKVDLPILQTAPGYYHYFNEAGDRVDITELCRKESGDHCDYIVRASGRRFFGRYDVIVHLQIIDAKEIGAIYTAQIHAYPHNGPMRFLVRKLGSIERYFRKNTRAIESVARKITEGLAEQSAFDIT